MAPAASKNVSGAILRRHFVVQHAGEVKVVDNQKILQIEYHIFSGIPKTITVYAHEGFMVPATSQKSPERFMRRNESFSKIEVKFEF